MSDNAYKCHQTHDAVDISVWENEGGALDRSNMNHHYGRRREPDKSWTIYHVFTGTPAEVSGRPMIGLSERAATTTMILLNIRNTERRSARLRQVFASPFKWV